MSKPVIFSSPTCQPCRAVKKWLQQNNVDYIEKDAMDNLEELKSLGTKITLPIVKHGTHIIQGFNPNELKKVFARD